MRHIPHSHFSIIAAFLRFDCWLFNFDPYKLNLCIEGKTMSKNIGDTITARIAPTATLADGSVVPAAVTNARYASAPPGVYGTPVIAADGLSAVFTAVAAGTGVTIACVATNAAGTDISETADAPDVVQAAPPAADKLNLTIDTAVGPT